MSTNRSNSYDRPYLTQLSQDSSFEIINDDNSLTSTMKAHGSLRSMRNSILNPLESVVQQNKDLKKLLEDCGKQMAKVKEDQDTMLDNLQQEKKKCNALEDETMRLQLEITSLHQKIAEITKERDDAINNVLPASPVTKINPNDHEMSIENNKERIKLDAMRQSKMETLAKNLAETKQQLEECQRHLKSKDNDLLTARKKAEQMRSQILLLEETLAEERGKKMEKENVLDSMKRSVTQLNVRLNQEKTTYDEEIITLNEAHGRELNNLRAEYDKRMDNLQQMNTNLQLQVNTLRQDISVKDKEKLEAIEALEAVHKKEIDDLTDTNGKLNRELGALKMAVQEKETTLSQMERERHSLNDNIKLMREQIQLYGSDFNAERHSREEVTADNVKLKQQIKDMEAQFQTIRDDFTTERTLRDTLATENDRLKEEIRACKAELVEKQSNNQDNTLRRQITEKDEQLNQLDANLTAERAEKQRYIEQVTQLTQQIQELQQRQGGHYPLPQQGGQFPPPHQGSHAPPSQLGGHAPQGDHVLLPQQGIGQSGIPRQLTNASSDILRANSHAYIPPQQQPEHRYRQRQPDDAAVPAGGPRDSTDILYPQGTAFVCPICERNDFVDSNALQIHAAFCESR